MSERDREGQADKDALQQRVAGGEPFVNIDNFMCFCAGERRKGSSNPGASGVQGARTNG